MQKKAPVLNKQPMQNFKTPNAIKPNFFRIVKNFRIIYWHKTTISLRLSNVYMFVF